MWVYHLSTPTYLTIISVSEINGREIQNKDEQGLESALVPVTCYKSPPPSLHSSPPRILLAPYFFPIHSLLQEVLAGKQWQQVRKVESLWVVCCFSRGSFCGL